MRASDWRAHVKNTLRGFFCLHLPSGIVLNECSLHEQGEKRWVQLPSKPQIEDGRHRIDPRTQKPAYVPVVAIPSREVRERFQAQALAAVDRMLGQ